MSPWLLDANVLVACSLAGHPFYARVRRWRQATMDAPIATCPVTEGALLRLHMQYARDKSPAAAWAALASIHAHPKHVFWPENFSYIEITFTRLTGHRQVTDSWLVELARRKGGRLATLNESLAVLWPDTAVLLPI